MGTFADEAPAAVEPTPETEPAAVPAETGEQAPSPSDAPPPDPPPPAADPPKLHKIKMKYNGQELEREYGIDPELIMNDPNLMADLQKGLAFERTTNDIKQRTDNLDLREAQVESVVKKFQSMAKDPKLALKQLGIDPQEYAQALLNEQVELAGMTDEQREIYALRQNNALQAQQLEKTQKTAEQQKVDADELVERKRYVETYAAMGKILEPAIPQEKARDALLSIVQTRNSAFINAHVQRTGENPSYKIELDFLDKELDSVEETADIITGARLEGLAADPEKLMKVLPTAVVEAVRTQLIARAEPGPDTGIGDVGDRSNRSTGRDPAPVQGKTLEKTDWKKDLNERYGTDV